MFLSSCLNDAEVLGSGGLAETPKKICFLFFLCCHNISFCHKTCLFQGFRLLNIDDVYADIYGVSKRLSSQLPALEGLSLL